MQECEHTETVSQEVSQQEVFRSLCAQYIELVQEKSAEFQAQKAEIEKSFEQQLKVVENYRKTRQEMVMNEGLFMQQLLDDKDM